MAAGVNIGNTLEYTTSWESGWGNPPVTREYVQRLAALGFKTVRLPVAWDTYAVDGRIPSASVAEGTQGVTEKSPLLLVRLDPRHFRMLTAPVGPPALPAARGSPA